MRGHAFACSYRLCVIDDATAQTDGTERPYRLCVGSRNGNAHDQNAPMRVPLPYRLCVAGKRGALPIMRALSS